MPLAPFQILVLPYRPDVAGAWQFAVFRRTDGDGRGWQALAGGGEDDETPEAATRREMWEEAQIGPLAPRLLLDVKADIPTASFKGRYAWADQLSVIPEYAFAVRLPLRTELTLSDEHAEMRWLGRRY